MSTDLRDSFFDEIYKIGAIDNRIVIITNDMDIFSLRRFKEKYPQRFVNAGVAEQNMINVAAGLASCGKKVIIYGILPFLIYRCYEQIKFNICSMNLDVLFVGIGNGLSFSFDGPTHHGNLDIPCLLGLPELEIYNPGDTYSANLVAKKAILSKKPTFVRLDKGVFPSFKSFLNYDGFNILNKLNKINIISTGYYSQFLPNINEYLKKNGYEAGLIDIYKLKEINKKIFSRVLSKSKFLFIIEEHSVNTGLGSVINNLIKINDLKIKTFLIGLKDQQIFDYGDRDWLLAKNRIDLNSIKRKLLFLIKKNGNQSKR